jgi:hypothetical protein
MFRKQSPAPRAPNTDNQHRALPEVSVNPHIQSSVQQNTDQKLYSHEPIQNGIFNNRIYLQNIKKIILFQVKHIQIIIIYK